MGAREELKNGYILIKVLGRGAETKLQMNLNGEREMKKKTPTPRYSSRPTWRVGPSGRTQH